MIGRRIGSLRAAQARPSADAKRRGGATRDPGAIQARFWGARRFVSVDLSRGRVPANVIGWLDGRGTADRDLAVAVNGRIAAVGQSFKPMGATGLEFSLMVPESAFHQGFNDVRVYELGAGSRPVELGRSPRA